MHEIRKALLGRPSRYRPVFELVLDYELGTWEQLALSARHIGLPDLYLHSVGWVTEVLTDALRCWSEAWPLLGLFSKHFLGYMESVVRRGDAAINGGLQ